MSDIVICTGRHDRPCVILAASAAVVAAAVISAATAVSAAAAAADDEDEYDDPPAVVKTKIHNDLSFVDRFSKAFALWYILCIRGKCVNTPPHFVDTL